MNARSRSLLAAALALAAALCASWFWTRSDGTGQSGPAPPAAPVAGARVATELQGLAPNRAGQEREPADPARAPDAGTVRQEPSEDSDRERITLSAFDELGNALEDLDRARLWVLASAQERAQFAELRGAWSFAGHLALQRQLAAVGQVFDTAPVSIDPGVAVAVVEARVGCRGWLELPATARGEAQLHCDATWRAGFEVLDGAGAPYSEQHVTLARWQAGREGSASREFGPKTDSAGRICVLLGEAHASYRDSIAAVGIEVELPLQGVVEQRVPRQRMAAPGHPLGLLQRLELPAGGRLVVDLLQPDGGPTTESWLTVIAVDVTDGAKPPPETFSGSLKGTGAVRTAEAVPFGRSLELYVLRDLSNPHGPFAVRGPTASEPTVRMTVVVPPPLLRVRVQLVDEQGRPVSDRTLSESVDWCVDGSSMGPARTDGDGRLELVLDSRDPVPPGSRGLRTAEWAGSFGEPAGWRLAFDPPLGPGDHDLGRLAPWSPLALVRGRVIDVAGQPVAGAQIVVREDAGERSVFSQAPVAVEPTDAEGRFELRGESGLFPLVLAASAPRSLSEVARIGEPGVEDLELVLRPLGLAQVRAAEGERLPEMRWTTPGGSLELHRAHAGRFMVDGVLGEVFGLAEGRYDAHVIARDGTVQRVLRNVEFTPGDPSADPRLNPLPAY